jgi:hypothetical protein
LLRILLCMLHPLRLLLRLLLRLHLRPLRVLLCWLRKICLRLQRLLLQGLRVLRLLQHLMRVCNNRARHCRVARRVHLHPPCADAREANHEPYTALPFDVADVLRQGTAGTAASAVAVASAGASSAGPGPGPGPIIAPTAPTAPTALAAPAAGPAAVGSGSTRGIGIIYCAAVCRLLCPCWWSRRHSQRPRCRPCPSVRCP